MRLNLLAILRRRCPACRRGRVFRRVVAMNARCPECDITFEREAGYFTGAMYASYFLGLATSMPVWMTMLLLGVNPGLILGITAVQLLVMSPLLFSYSRVVWLHVDNMFNPFVPPGAEG